MHLTREEEAILKGARGEATARALEVVVRVGEALGAERLVPIRHAHVSGVSYGNIGEAGARLLEELAEAGARFSVPTTVNPLGFDLDKPDLFPLQPGYLRGQMRIIRALHRMGAIPSFTCTPYETSALQAQPLEPGAHVAWGESSAVVYANSFLGLRTNREGGPLALMAAVAGRTYYYGLHQPEERVPEVEYRVEAGRPLNEAEAGVLGMIIGEAHRSRRPPALRARFEGRLALRELSAALGAAGSIGMVYVHGLTPERLPRGWRPEEVVELEAGEIAGRLEEMAPPDPSGVDLYFAGCPHYTVGDLEALAAEARRLGGVRREFIVAIPREAYVEALGRGLIGELRSLGFKVVRDTCLIVSPYPVEGRSIVTNSYKALFYLTRRGARVYLASAREMVRMAAGAW
jgi:predicted aconitase